MLVERQKDVRTTTDEMIGGTYMSFKYRHVWSHDLDAFFSNPHFLFSKTGENK